MRELQENEIKQVSGAGRKYNDCPKRKKGNNGFGNGGNDGSPNGKQDDTR